MTAIEKTQLQQLEQQIGNGRRFTGKWITPDTYAVVEKCGEDMWAHEEIRGYGASIEIAMERTLIGDEIE
jgi:hypothetical protein